MMSTSLYPVVVAAFALAVLPGACSLESDSTRSIDTTMSSPRLAELGVDHVVMHPTADGLLIQLVDADGEAAGTIAYESDGEQVDAQLVQAGKSYAFARDVHQMQYWVDGQLVFHKTRLGVSGSTHDENSERDALALETIVQVLALFEPLQGFENDVAEAAPTTPRADDETELEPVLELGVARVERAATGAVDEVVLLDATDTVLAAVEIEQDDAERHAETDYGGSHYEFVDGGDTWEFIVDGVVVKSVHTATLAAGERPTPLDPSYEYGFSYIGAAMEVVEEDLELAGVAPVAVASGSPEFELRPPQAQQHAVSGSCEWEHPIFAGPKQPGTIKKGGVKTGTATAPFGSATSRAYLCGRAESAVDDVCANDHCSSGCYSYGQCSAWCLTSQHYCWSAEHAGFECDCKRNPSSGSTSSGGGASSAGGTCCFETAVGCSC
ncbi:MAG: hypothetical protein AAF721_00075 [Myxococcota bacterium]